MNVPTEILVYLRFSTAGGQETGAVPRLDLSESATPKATMTRPMVATRYLLNKLFSINFRFFLQIWLKIPNFASTMGASSFIAGRLRFRSKIAVACIAVSFLVMIIAVSVTSGFRSEIRSGISEIFGDIQITADGSNYISDESVLDLDQPYMAEIQELGIVKKAVPAVYKAGIIKKDDIIQGIMFKGVPDGPDSLGASIPSVLAGRLSLSVGDRMTVYFAGEKVRVRNFTVRDIYGAVLGGEDKLVVYTSLKDMQAVCGFGAGEASALEIILKGVENTPEALDDAASEIGTRLYASYNGDGVPPVATSSFGRFPQVFSWLDLLDVNVLLILGLMTAVAGFNMISGLLIALLRNISAIGILKSMGMKDKSIAGAFLEMASKVVLKGLLIGNVAGLGFCLLQKYTHFITLNPENYFVSYVPVNIDIVRILATDVAAFGLIMLLLLLPSLFISGVDPARTVKVR